MIRNAENTIQRKIAIIYAFYSKLIPLPILKKFKIFFQKTLLLFFKKKPKFLKFWKLSLFQSHSMANLLHFDEKKLTFKHVSNWFWLAYASSIGKHRVKKRTYLRGRYCFHIFKNMAQINEKLWHWSGERCLFFGFSEIGRLNTKILKSIKEKFVKEFKSSTGELPDWGVAPPFFVFACVCVCVFVHEVIRFSNSHFFHRKKNWYIFVVSPQLPNSV